MRDRLWGSWAVDPGAAATDWWQILQLYDQLLALALVDGLDLGGYHLFHAIRTDLLRRLGRNTEAALAYQAALARTENAAERDFLRRSRQALA